MNDRGHQEMPPFYVNRNFYISYGSADTGDSYVSSSGTSRLPRTHSEPSLSILDPDLCENGELEWSSRSERSPLLDGSRLSDWRNRSRSMPEGIGDVDQPLSGELLLQRVTGAPDNQEEDPSPIRTQYTGLIFILLACLCMTISSASIQVIHVPVYTVKVSHVIISAFPILGVVRFAGSLLLTLPVFIYRKELPRLPSTQDKIVTFNVAVLNAIFHYCLFTALKVSPIGYAACLSKVVSYVVYTLLSRTLVRESITMVQLISMTIGLSGLFLIIHFSDFTYVRPGRIYTLLSRLHVPALLAGTMAAFKDVIQRKWLPHVDVFVLQFYINVGALVLPATILGPLSNIKFVSFWDLFQISATKLQSHLHNLHHYSMTTIWILLVCHSFSTGIATLLLYQSKQMLSSSVHSLMFNMYLVFMLITQYTVLDTEFKFYHVGDTCGVVVVIASAMLVPCGNLIKEQCYPIANNG